MSDSAKGELGSANGWKFMNEFWFKVTFVYRCEHLQKKEEKEEEEVYLAGDFNQWSERSHKMSPCPEGYSATLLLSEGFYHYKFIVGGRWLRDASNPHVGGAHGNSVMFVHMDPQVCVLRDQNPPHREYHRPRSDGGQFCVRCPPLSQDVASLGVLQRLIFVYLPPSYVSEPDRRYPVVYANDGQNLFSTPEHLGGPLGGGWFLDAKLDHYWSQGWLPEFILVGVPNSDFVCPGNRTREYCVSRFHDTSDDGRNPYARYLIDVVKREVDDVYRTRPSSSPGDTVVMGASMGGLSAFTLCLNHPNVFSSCICMSPSFWYVDKEDLTAFDLLRTLTSDPPQTLTSDPRRCRVYIDSGDGVGDNCYETSLMRDVLLEAGWKEGEEFCYVLDMCSSRVDMGVTHCESVWAERVLPALQFALRYVQ